MSIETIVARLNKRIEAIRPDSPELRAALTRIGILVSSQAVINYRQVLRVRTGRLINSIRYELFQMNNEAGVRVGSFGVPYAAAHEFGFRGGVNIPSHTRNIRQAFGRPIDQKAINIRPHTRFMNLRKRAFIRPAVLKHRETIVDLLRQVASL